MAGKQNQLLATRYSLLSRIADWKDQESWRDFFDTYWRLIYGSAISAGLTDAEAQDVVQETVMCVANDIGKFKRDRALGSFKGWLRNIIRWRIADQVRKRLPRPPGDEFSEPDQSTMTALESMAGTTGPDLDSEWEKEWQENLLQTAIHRAKARIREEHFQIFDLYAVKKWPVKKVAQSLGVSVPLVYLVKHRVAGLIRKEVHNLEKHWF